MECMAGNPQP
ncbi:hypothetical protein F383_33878 [Gossypium arboreum]|uniref:Uncharacterized protein n=1 Tax=Gossypium arboreum TaxID=29729 RepID=A0A0B0PT53_GOSAR|nr:hypothetical protein F383_33878 [Gossypium arboreum]